MIKYRHLNLASRAFSFPQEQAIQHSLQSLLVMKYFKIRSLHISKFINDKIYSTLCSICTGNHKRTMQYKTTEVNLKDQSHLGNPLINEHSASMSYPRPMQSTGDGTANCSKVVYQLNNSAKVCKRLVIDIHSKI